VISKVDSILVAFESEEVTLAEQVQERMEAARGCLKAFIKKASRDSAQFVMAIVKSHDLEVDLDPVGEGVAAVGGGYPSKGRSTTTARGTNTNGTTKERETFGWD
jgi:hypothetical protein